MGAEQDGRAGVQCDPVVRCGRIPPEVYSEAGTMMRRWWLVNGLGGRSHTISHDLSWARQPHSRSLCVCSSLPDAEALKCRGALQAAFFAACARPRGPSLRSMRETSMRVAVVGTRLLWFD